MRTDVPPEKIHPADRYEIIAKADFGLGEFSPEAQVDAATQKHFREVYFSRCAAADDLMGQVLQRFHEHGDASSTYILFIADHGEMNTEHRMTGK